MSALIRLWAAVRAWGVWAVLTEGAAKVWRVANNAPILATLGLLGAWTVQTVRLDGLIIRPHIGAIGFTLIDIEGWRPRARAAELALAQAKTAQPLATAAQAAVNHLPAAISAAIAKASDDDAQGYYEKGRAAGAAYAAAHSVRAACPDGGSGHADLPGADHPAPVDDRPGDAASMVAVARVDFDLLTANSVRLAKVHQDAESLIAAGVAQEENQSRPN